MKEKHVLVCIRDGSDHERVLKTASEFSSALKARLSAIVVEYPQNQTDTMIKNIALIEEIKARIITMDEKDYALQTAEYARISDATHILLQEDVSLFSLLRGKSLSSQLSALVPDVELMIISRRPVKKDYKIAVEPSSERFSALDALKMTAVLLACTGIGYLFLLLGLTDVNVIMVYLIGVLFIAMLTSGRAYSLVSSILSVLIFNFFFTSPYFTLMSDPKNITTFAVMFLAALLQSSLTVRIKSQVVESSQKAYRTEVLLESSQVLSQAEGTAGVLEACAVQLRILLEKDVLMAEVDENNEILPPMYFPFGKYEMEAALDTEAAQCALERKQVCGNTTSWCPESELMVWPVVGSQKVLALCGLHLQGQTLKHFEKNLMSSILEQCALVLEAQRAVRMKQEVEEAARQEALRSNLLRMISHDLRTPLTSISGNALLLMDSSSRLNVDKVSELAQSIHEDARWLIQLVENLLSITRIENGSMKIHFESELIEEVIQEALHHVDPQIASHTLNIEIEDEWMMAKMDASLIVQVLINLINNAIKYTPYDSEIKISAHQRKKDIVIQVSDNGQGISKEKQDHLFEMFTTFDNLSGDSRRGMGLGLALCRSIIHAHGGQIRMMDNLPHGAVFEFTLKAAEEITYE